jgi:hypothetical protein
MLQIKTFKLEEDKKANEFIKGVRLIENGVQIRENCIVVLYDEAIDFDAKSREVALITKLSTNEGSLLAAQIKKEYYELVTSNAKLSLEMEGDRDRNIGEIDNLTAQIYIIKKMLGRDVGEPVIFGKKMYKEKKAK